MAKRTLWNKPSAVSSEPQDLEEIAREQRRYQAAWDDLSEAGTRSFRRLLLVPAIWISVALPLSHLIDGNAAFGIGFAASIAVQIVLRYLRPIRSTRNFPCPRCGKPFFYAQVTYRPYRPSNSIRSRVYIADSGALQPPAQEASRNRCANCGLPFGALPPDFYPPDTLAPAK